jgi:hypothetical protein
MTLEQTFIDSIWQDGMSELEEKT